MNLRGRLAAIAVLGACGSSPSTELSMSFARAGFYDAPFPSDDLRGADGHIDLSALPDPEHSVLMQQALALIAGADGFAQTGAIYFSASDALDPTSLPDLAGSIAPGAAVFVMSIDATAADYLKPRPISVAFLADGGPYGVPDMLALLPLQGAPLGAGERYAAVVTTAVRDAAGHPLAPSATMAALAVGHATPELGGTALASYHDALGALTSAGVEVHTVAALAVFTTEHATAALDTVRADALARPLPTISTPTVGDTFPGYCVFDATIAMPDYQNGTAPYSTQGGAWTFDATGKPIVDHVETARVVFTIPRGPTPAAGWPLVVFVRTGGGGDRPLVDRGVCATPDFTTPITPGSGPASDLAAVGFAGVQVDGPLGGPRNPTGADEEFLIFNIQNAAALRDNVRESAAELALFRHVVGGVTFDASSCPGAGQIAFDPAHVALMGHSMGGWIAPLVLATEPTIGAAVLSGAGGSFIANILDKQKPTQVSPVLSALLGFPGRPLEAHDPALTLVQWAAEPADPQVYAPLVVHEPPPGATPRSVLMLQGIVDHYILPSIADATSLGLGLDEAGPAYDASNAELQTLGQPSLAPLLPLAGRTTVDLPIAANIDAHTTAVVIQHPGDAIEDGHEMMFQTEPPKHQYRCFLASWLTGTPRIPADGAEADPCTP